MKRRRRNPQASLGSSLTRRMRSCRQRSWSIRSFMTRASQPVAQGCGWPGWRFNPANGIWLVGQGTAGGRFHIFGARLTADETTPVALGTTAANSWAPSATVTPDGLLHAVWDAYEGQSYKVFEQNLRFRSPVPGS